MTEQAIDLAIGKSLFAYILMAVIAMLAAVMIRGIVSLLAAGKARQAAKTAAVTPVVVSVNPARDESKEIAAAIAAAVYTVLGAHRLVYIGEARPTFSWTSELRTRLHTSHAPRLNRR
jgi:hypothetical protein